MRFFENIYIYLLRGLESNAIQLEHELLLHFNFLLFVIIKFY